MFIKKKNIICVACFSFFFFAVAASACCQCSLLFCFRRCRCSTVCLSVLLMDFVVVPVMILCCFCTLYLLNVYGLDAHRMLNLRKQLFLASYCIYFAIILAHCTAIFRAQHQLFAAKMLSCRAANRATIGYI